MVRSHPADEAYGVRGAFNHNWDPYWSTSLFGSYRAVRYNGTTQGNGSALCYTGILRCTGGLAGKSADYTCNPDFNVDQVGAVTRWTPVKNLTFSAEVMYFRLDQKFTGTATLDPTAPKPTTTYEYKDQEHRVPSTFALSVTSDPDRLILI